MAFLAVAAILDALDGRMARLLKATSKMGEEIDSLADAVNFGVAPAFIVYGTLLSHSRVGWIVVLLYAVCIVLRLARYNAMLDARPARLRPRSTSSACPPRPARSARSVRWPPRCSSATAGGRRESAVVIWMIGVSLLVVSTIPMRKVHTFAVSPNMVVPLLALLADRRRRVDPVRLHRDPGDHRGLRHPHPVRGPNQAWLVEAPRGVGRQAQGATRRRGGRSAGAPAQPHRRSMARLGLRRPPGRVT